MRPRLQRKRMRQPNPTAPLTMTAGQRLLALGGGQGARERIVTWMGWTTSHEGYVTEGPTFN